MTTSAHWSRAVVTGAGGFIGQHMVRYLRQQGVETLAVDRCAGPDKGPVDRVLDLSEPGVLDRFLAADVAVFHLAGSADVRASVAVPWDDFQDNVVTSLQVLESVRKARCPMLFPSSGSVYDTQAPLPFHETSPLRPSSPYGAAKLAVEAYCSAYHRTYGVDVRIARMFSVFGPGMRRFAIHDFFHRLRDNPQQLVIGGDGGQSRDYLFVEDAVRALYWILREGGRGEVYNVASGQPRSILAVAQAVVAAMRLPECRVNPDGIPFAAEVYRMEAAVGKLNNLGFTAAVSFEEGIARTIACLQQHHR